MFTTLVAGHVCLDLTPGLTRAGLPRPGELVPSGPLELTVGGCVGNTGVALRALGVDCTVSAAVGRDALGVLVGSVLRDRFGGDRVQLETTDLATSYSVVVDPPGGDRAFWHHVGANALYRGDDLPAADIVHLGYPTALPALTDDDGEPLERLLARAHDLGATTSIDLSAPGDDVSAARDWPSILARVLPVADVVSPSLVDVRLLVPELATAGAQEAARWLVEAGAAVALVTDGEHGAAIAFADAARLRSGGRALSGAHPADDRRVVAPVTTVARTTGAGDVASAGLVAAIALGLDAARWGEAAVAAASAHVAGRPLEGAIVP